MRKAVSSGLRWAVSISGPVVRRGVDIQPDEEE
jgi:hypothetical protein